MMRPSILRQSLGVVGLAVVVGGCHQNTAEIVLVVDTNLTVPVDIDHIDIGVSGAVDSSAPIAVALTATTPAFPLSLGLVSGGSLSPVVVSVSGLSVGNLVLRQDASTSFVAGEQRLLRMLLLSSCLGIVCGAGETCDETGCVPVARPGTSLPLWTGTLPSRPHKPPVTPIGGRTVWASGWHSAAIEGGTLYAWGQNADGQLGTGTTQNANSRRPVMNVKNPASVGLGQLHSCVCDQAKQAWCWGRNAEGQLGTGDLIAQKTPAAVNGLVDCEQIAGGSHHACAVHTDGTVSCWGLNTFGQTGQTAGTVPVIMPQLVPGLTDVAEVQCGEFYSCARRNDGAVLCWGRNDVAQLGDGTTTNRSTPAPVAGLGTDVVELVAGRFFVCVRHLGGVVSCWGANSAGQLGIATPAQSGAPLDVAGISDAVQLAAGQQHVCAIHRTGGLACWGGNLSGQLGNGNITNSMTPMDVMEIADVTSVAAGSVHTCARHSGGVVSCWGDNLVNQLGDGSTTNRTSPVTVAGF